MTTFRKREGRDEGVEEVTSALGAKEESSATEIYRSPNEQNTCLFCVASKESAPHALNRPKRRLTG